MTDYAHSSYANAARERKAMALEHALRLGGFDSERVEGMDDEHRKQACKIAGVRPASDETWAVVLRLMRSAEHRD